ncbi:MAG: sulfur carrier protein ThiS [Planctomycetes bacterium]|nr:sulfur carrier protein ThiS [Planctomycetota bacterium]
MQITVNGAPRRVDARASVKDLLLALSLAAEHVAVERNGRLVPRREHERTALREGDRIEVVTLVGGG